MGITTMPGQNLGEQGLQYGVQSYHHMKGECTEQVGTRYMHFSVVLGLGGKVKKKT